MVRRFDGANWVDVQSARRFNGTNWVDTTIKRFDGSNWIKVFPNEKVININRTTFDKLIRQNSYYDPKISYYDNGISMMVTDRGYPREYWYGGCITHTIPIDFTPYKTLIVRGNFQTYIAVNGSGNITEYVGESGFGIRYSSDIPQGGESYYGTAFKHYMARYVDYRNPLINNYYQDIPMDISDMNGNMYICIYTYTGANGYANFDVSKITLKKD